MALGFWATVLGQPLPPGTRSAALASRRFCPRSRPGQTRAPSGPHGPPCWGSWFLGSTQQPGQTAPASLPLVSWAGAPGSTPYQAPSLTADIYRLCAGGWQPQTEGLVGSGPLPELLVVGGTPGHVDMSPSQCMLTQQARPCACLCPNSSFCKDIRHMRLGPSLLQGDHILTS